MKHILKSIGIILLFLALSCRKEESILNNSFIKSYQHDFDLTIVESFQLSDGNFLVAASDMKNVQDGKLLKIDASGNQVWEKSLSPEFKYLWSAFAVPGSGFVTFGIKNYDAYSLQMCLYDVDGNKLLSDSIVTGSQHSEKTPYKMLRLANGNYAMVGCSGQSIGIRIISPALQVLSSYSFNPLLGSTIYCSAVCEMPDASIHIIVNISGSDNLPKNLFVVKFGPNANFISSNYYPDTIYRETVNAIVPHDGGLFAVSSRMQGANLGYDAGLDNNSGVILGSFSLGYYYYAALIYGTINLSRFTDNGFLISKKEIDGYPNNGMIYSIQQTSEGGYILCGTVNQLSSILERSDTKIYMLKLDNDLNVQWSKMINTVYPAIGVNALQTSDGGYLVTGMHRSLNNHCVPLVIKTDARGNL